MEEIKPTRVLCVDDEEAILNSLKRTFRDRKFSITVSNDPKVALDLIKKNEFDVVISDMRMPEIDGAKVLATAADFQPDSIRILLSGYSDSDALSRAINDGRIHQFMHKPWENNELKDAVEVELERRALYSEQNRISEELDEISDKLRSRERELEKQLETKDIELTNAGYIIEMANDRIEAALRNTFRMLSQISMAKAGRSTRFAQNLAKHCLVLGQQNGLSRQQLKLLTMAASLCELGKIRFKEALAQSIESKLSPEEWKLYQRYPSIGADLLLPVEGMNGVSEILRQYRECIDGSGFPNQLRDNEISLEAKILAVVYFYQDCIEDTELRPGVSSDEAAEQLYEHGQRHFDENLVDAYVKLLPSFAEQEEPKDDTLGTFQLATGQIVSRDLISEGGILLLSKGTELNEHLITRLQVFEAQHREKLIVNVWQHTSQ